MSKTLYTKGFGPGWSTRHGMAPPATSECNRAQSTRTSYLYLKTNVRARCCTEVRRTVLSFGGFGGDSSSSSEGWWLPFSRRGVGAVCPLFNLSLLFVMGPVEQKGGRGMNEQGSGKEDGRVCWRRECGTTGKDGHHHGSPINSPITNKKNQAGGFQKEEGEAGRTGGGHPLFAVSPRARVGRELW